VGLPVAEHQTAFVESLVGSKGHLEVIPDSHQENAPFWQVHSCLPDDLIEELVVDFLSDGTDAAFPGLLLNQLSFEYLLKVLQLTAAGFPSADVEAEEPSISLEDIGFKHFIEEFGIFGIEV
jgi:hypothetical protein